VYQRTQEELDKILFSGGGVQMGTERAAEFKAPREEKTPLQSRRTRV